MKKWVKYVFGFTMLVVYFIGIYTPSTNDIHSAIHHYSESDTVKAGHSIDVPFHLLHSDSASNWISSSFKGKQKSLNTNFIAAAIVTEQLYKATFLQRKYCAENTVALFHKAKIFYPFHSFW